MIGASGTWFRWTVGDRAARLRALYVDLGLGPVAVAAAIGEGCTAQNVTDGVRMLGLKRPRRPTKGAFEWTPERVDALRRLYVGLGLAPEIVAARIGQGCTPLKVRRKVHVLGLMAAKLAAGHAVRPGGRGAAMARPGPRMASRGVRRARAVRVARCGRLAGPASPVKLAYALRFVRAGWAADEAAWLFDLDVAAVAATWEGGR
ncbi:MAG: hypothetical protein Q8L23_15845 [Caulobacter sp.]|nr:hypothetical protein [Caulobacter sp.]